MKINKAPVEEAAYDRLGPKTESSYMKKLNEIVTVHAKNEDEQIEEAITKLYKKDFGRILRLMRKVGVREDSFEVKRILREHEHECELNSKTLKKSEAERFFKALGVDHFDMGNYNTYPIIKLDDRVYVNRNIIFARNNKIKILTSFVDPCRTIREVNLLLDSYADDGATKVYQVKRQTIYITDNNEPRKFVGHMYRISVYVKDGQVI